MNTHFFFRNEHFVSGMTLKSETAFEQNNMALHTCDNPSKIIGNRKNLAITLDTQLENFVCANQTHSANFYRVTAEDKGRGALSMETAIPNTDALYTFEPNIVLCCFTADCVPVIFYHEKRNVIGVIHSGWQGTVKQITRKLFHHLITEEKCEPNEFHIQIGSALCQEKFEVDEDVYEKFHELGYAEACIHYNEDTKKYHIDNQKTVIKQCELAGISQDQMKVDTTCTFLNTEGFSYREDKRTGRHLSFIMRKK